ncbi:MAG: type II secretion system protein [Phycisphaerales bacterium]|nr:MAG: type II secretion system protein [Phycisphaerales bacterium]
MHCNYSNRRQAFSLAEVIVAMGILALMMTLAGEVMNMTVEATGRARALTDVNQALRIFERTLRDDLASLDREGSVMVIQGNRINAYWTREGAEADVNNDASNGYPHDVDPLREDPEDPGVLELPRADMLMFFTTSKEVSNYVRYQSAGAGSGQPVKSNLQQVVYGHADFGEFVEPRVPPPIYVFQPEVSAFPEFPDISSLPQQRWAQDWHLARRSVVLTSVESPPGVGSPFLWLDWQDLLIDSADMLKEDPPDALLGDTDILTGNHDVVAEFSYEDAVLRRTTAITGLCLLPEIFPAVGDVDSDYPVVPRSRLDLTPPPLYSDRLGHYFLPNCASFKIEWCLDPDSEFVGNRLNGEKRVFWIDPGADDPLVAFKEVIALEQSKNLTRYQNISELLGKDADDKDVDEAATGHWGAKPYTLEQRFASSDTSLFPPNCGYGDPARPNLAIFAATAPDTDGNTIREDIFPAALRITLDMFDDGRRLDRPIRHVIVVPVGG